MKRGDFFRVYQGSTSVPKALLTNYIGHLSDEKLQAVNNTLRIALATG
jgi:mRNA-degrading endonuclease toxin of MazEF toxin-antitoxin module